MPHWFDGRIAFSEEWAKQIHSGLDYLKKVSEVGGIFGGGLTVPMDLPKLTFSTSIVLPALGVYIAPKLKRLIASHRKEMAKVPALGPDGFREPEEPNVRVDIHRTDVKRD